MSAIVGLFHCDGRPVDPELPRRMLDRLAHRGRDAADIRVGESWALGARVGWTTPESRLERMPLASPDGDLTLVADARIDNRRELLALLLPDRPAAEVADGDLILAAYRRWGADAPAHLVGDFAFVIRDEARRTLFCARDHIGVRPFFYHHSPDRFLFASELKAILVDPDVPRRISETRIADYLTSLFDDKEITFYESIRRLPPSHTLTITPEGALMRRYASLDPVRELRLGSNEEYALAFRECFIEAVRCRLRGSHPIGSALSGGLDSSSIVCVARRLLADDGRGALPTFSAVFDEVTVCDERRYIEKVVAGGGIVPHYVHADAISPLVEIERIFAHQDEPFFAPNLFMHWELYRSAEREGVRVFLDGLDGDTTVSHGHAFLIELARTGRWLKLHREMAMLTRGMVRDTEWNVFRRGVVNPLILRPLRKRWRAATGRETVHWGKDTVIGGEFARRMGMRERFEMLGQGENPAPRTLRQEHAERLEWGVMPFLMEVADRSAWAFGIEPRYPFFDRRLIELALSLPPEQKLDRGWTRVVLRRAMEGILPPEIQWRVDKSNLGPNFYRSLRHFESERMREVVGREPSPLAPYVDMPRLRDIERRYRSGAASEEEVLALWKALTLAMWMDGQ
jgi:asparagine synthase (glutamine-hydrolysing)